MANRRAYDSLRGIAQWVKEHAHTLAEFLGLVKAQASHHTTLWLHTQGEAYGSILGRAVDAEQSGQGQSNASPLPAAIHNVVLGLCARCGYINAAEARRRFAAHLAERCN